MPHHRHPVTAEDKPLDIDEIECGLRTWPRMGLRPGGLNPASPEQAAEKTSAFICLRRVCLVVLAHCVSPACYELVTTRPYRRINGRLAIDPSLIVICYRRSRHGCPERSGPDMPGRTRSERGLLPPQ